MKTLIHNAYVISGHEPRFLGGILIDHGIIQQVLKQHEIEQINLQDVYVIDANQAYLLPGMIDIHLHGSYGYDFIRHAQDAVDHVAKGLPSEGTTSFMASLTVISHEECCNLLHEYAHLNQPKNSAHFLGVHSEGPYLSEKCKALMDETYLRDPSIHEFDEMLEASKHTLKIMTIAPERQGMDEFIDHVQGVSLMIGHSNATCTQALHALNKKVKGFTHLYNAMSQHQHREPGCVSAAFLDENAYCELIVDGFHVKKEVIQATWKILGKKRIILITDAMLGKGMPDGDYVFSKLNCRKKGNTVQVIDTGRIAGSAITMLDAIKNMHDFCGCTMEDLVQMACINPSVIAQADQKYGSIQQGKIADLILINDQFELLSTWIDGRQVYQP